MLCDGRHFFEGWIVQSLKVLATEPATGPSAAPDISALAKRFVEPARGDEPAVPRPAFPKPTLVTQALNLPDMPVRSASEMRLSAAPQRKRRLNRNAVVSAVVMLALIPLAVLFVRLWQDNVAPRAADGAAEPAAAGSATPGQQNSTLEVALSSPDRVEAKAGEAVAFPIVIDATAALPARSIVAVTALPEGATFSEGRPYGETGWSLRPDEIGDLQLRLPVQGSAADIRLELVAGDGTVLAQSETRLSVAPAPDAAQPVAAVSTDPFAAVATAPAATEPSEQVEASERTGSIASVPAPIRKPTASADSSVRVNKVKAVTIPAPRAARPHDGAYALAPAQDDPQTSGEWMVTKTAVDMHAKAEQRSDTVKVADKGLKVRVTARDKNWIQVHDPKSSTTGWIYNRFLTPADAPAQ
jgi:hypothetical protein